MVLVFFEHIVKLWLQPTSFSKNVLKLVIANLKRIELLNQRIELIFGAFNPLTDLTDLISLNLYCLLCPHYFPNDLVRINVNFDLFYDLIINFIVI